MARELPEGMLDDLAVLISNADKVPAVKNFQKYSGVGIFGLGRRMARDLGLSADRTHEFLLAISKFQNFRDIREESPAQFIETLTTHLTQDAPQEWRDKFLDGWKQCANAYADLFTAIDDDHPLTIARKAQELAYSHQNIYVSSRLITDVRPVFDSKAERIHDFVVTHMLSIEYTDGRQNRTTLTLAMDALDIENMQVQCDRAATKIQTLRKELSNFNTIVMPDLELSEGEQ